MEGAKELFGHVSKGAARAAVRARAIVRQGESGPRAELSSPLFWGFLVEWLRFAAMKTQLLIGGLACFAIGLLGCGGSLQGVEKELAAMRAELTALRAKTTVLSERVAGLEREENKAAETSAEAISNASKPSLNEGAGEKKADGDRPELSVVRVMPAGALGIGFKDDGPRDESLMEQPDEIADDDANRMVLRSVAGGGVVAEKLSDAAKKPAQPALAGVKPKMNTAVKAANGKESKP